MTTELVMHPSDQTLASFVEGNVDAKSRGLVLAHIETCSECMAAVLSADAHLSDERAATPSHASAFRWWMAIAAALLIAVVAVPLLLRKNEPAGRLVALAPRSARVVEPRLTGGFAWAEYAGTDRGTAGSADPEQMKLSGAAGEIIERANRDRDADSQHAAGVAMVLVQRPAEAITRLEAAAAESKDAKIWSDLAAARYAAAAQLGRASLYPTALAAADNALRIDPKLSEALFNRALILERLGLTDEARRAWQQYLDADSSPAWAAEARAHLAGLPRSTRSSQFERDRPLLEKAAERGDRPAVRGYVTAYRDRARAYAEAEYLGRWGEALQRSDEHEATRWLSIARSIGDALREVSGESLAADAVAAIDRASPSDRNAIAAAHVLYRNARIAYSRDQGEAAERDLLRAAAMFDSASDPMALMARYYAASARLARNDTDNARMDLERARVASDAHPFYVSLGAHVRWELGRARMLKYDWSGSVPVLGESAAMFRRSGERASEAFVEMMLARSLSSLSREDEAWLARIRGFAAVSAEGETELLATSVAATLRSELLLGRTDAALALSALDLSIARSGSRPQLVLEALVSCALIESASGHQAGALQEARQAGQIANRTAGAALRERNEALVAMAMGAALADGEPRAAAAPLTRAIDFYTAHDLPFALPESLLLRSRCAARTGDPAAAVRDLERGIAIVEGHRAAVGSVVAGATVLDAEHAIFEDAIRLRLDRGGTAAAFAFAERSHGSAITLTELQQRLAGSGTVVLEIVALPDELITFAVSGNDAIVARRARPRDTLVSLADESLSESGTPAAATLYDDLIRPVDAALRGAREVVIVPDLRLESVPFAALYDSRLRRHLVERFAVSIAASAGSLSRDDARSGALSLATIALPAGGAESVALPEAETEVRDIAAFYTRVQSIPAAAATLAALRTASERADVIHIAGHTEQQHGGGEQAFLVAGAAGNVERVSGRTIVAQPAMHARVIVLAACETLRAPASAATHSLSLGGAFSAAGAGDVIGTLAPIGDRDARRLFGALHRHLAAGARSADALRAAQIEDIATDKINGGRRAWRALALLTRRIAAPS